MVKRALTLLTSILIALPLLMPFNIYGAGETQIVPTYTSSTTQQEWQNKLRITNYCEGTNASTASCKLQFYVTGPYYGIINIDGYDSSNTHWINGGYIFISDGYGEYNYNFYQNGVKQISSISIWGVQLFQPDSNVDLSQIISLLTSINTYNQQGVNNQSTQIQQIQAVINDLIVSNGYLETITKLRQYNFPIESYTFVNQFFRSNYEIIDQFAYGYYQYPLFSCPSGALINSLWSNNTDQFNQILIIGINENIFDSNSILSYFDLNNISIKSFEFIYRKDRPGGQGNSFTIFKIEFNIEDVSNGNYGYFSLKNNENIMPIYCDYYSNRYKKYFSTDFALHFGLTNDLLNDLHLIANGTTASQSAAQSSNSANSQLQTDSNNLFNQEDNFKSDMQSAMQNVNNTFRLSDMGTKFVSSAQWVRTQYEHLTNNTPFASMITFSLITGLALILLGKVYK